MYLIENNINIVRSDETIIESQSKIEYFGHNRSQSNAIEISISARQCRISITYAFLGAVQSPYCANKPSQTGLLYNVLRSIRTTVGQVGEGVAAGWVNGSGHTR